MPLLDYWTSTGMGANTFRGQCDALSAPSLLCTSGAVSLLQAACAYLLPSAQGVQR